MLSCYFPFCSDSFKTQKNYIENHNTSFQQSRFTQQKLGWWERRVAAERKNVLKTKERKTENSGLSGDKSRGYWPGRKASSLLQRGRFTAASNAAAFNRCINSTKATDEMCILILKDRIGVLQRGGGEAEYLQTQQLNETAGIFGQSAAAECCRPIHSSSAGLLLQDMNKLHNQFFLVCQVQVSASILPLPAPQRDISLCKEVQGRPDVFTWCPERRYGDVSPEHWPGCIKHSEDTLRVASWEKTYDVMLMRTAGVRWKPNNTPQ